jgi:hypothetical protein
MRRNIVVSAVLFFLFLPLAGLAAGPVGEKQCKVDGVSQSWLARVQRDIAAREYHAAPARYEAGKNLLQAPNRRQNLRSWFTGGGVMVRRRVPGNSSWSCSLKPEAVGVAGRMHKLEFAAPVAEKNRVSYRSGYLEQWYENRPEGLEQGFTIPKSLGRGELRLRLAIAGGLKPKLANETTLVLLSPSGAAVLEYGNLRVVDAAGRLLASRFSLSGSKLIIHVETTNAVYPLTIDPLLLSLDWQVEGNQEKAYMGDSVAGAGDVNHDGFADVIVGACLYDYGGKKDAGAVFVYLGSATGLGKLPVWQAGGDQVEGLFGISVAGAGDVNRDGYDDIIIGAELNDYGGKDDAGAAYVYLGSAAGLENLPAWQAGGDRVGGLFGESVAGAGDVNRDGYDDIIIGASGYEYDGKKRAGAAFVFLGAADGLQNVPVWQVQGEQEWALLGSSVSAAGDVNGDGYGDVVLGAYGYDGAGGTDAGAAYVYLGKAGGLENAPIWRTEGDQRNADFGISVARAGDVNHDGYDDVIIGAQDYNSGVYECAGAAFVYLGKATGLENDPVWKGEGKDFHVYFGCSVSGAGDVNNDGYDDVVIGAFAEDYSHPDKGAVYVFLGMAAGLTDTPVWQVVGEQRASMFGESVAGAGDVDGDGFDDIIVGASRYDNGQVREGAAFLYRGSRIALSITPDWYADSGKNFAGFGYAVASAGDVNGDGFGDIVVGAPWYDTGAVNAGRAFVYSGAASGLGNRPIWSWSPNQAEAQFGCSVASAGSVNGDEYSDIVIGAPYYSHGEDGEGAVFIFPGSSAGLGTVPWPLESNQAGASFGYSVASAGDVNHDGFADVIVGAPGYDHGQTNEGAVFIYPGVVGGVSSAPWPLESNQYDAGLGWSVSGAGNLNGDVYADIVAGAPKFSNGENSEGAVFVWNGSGNGPISPPLVIESNQSSSMFGNSVACAGDVNGDGFDDVVVGAPDFDNGETDEGVVFIYPGSFLGLVPIPFWVLEINLTAARFGWSVAGAGDVNGDGFADLIIGIPFYSNGETSEGAALLYAGSPNGIPFFPAGGVESNQANARFGWSVAGAGDVNGDGCAELLVGAPGYNNGDSDEGAAFVYDLGSSLILYVSRDGSSGGHTPCYKTVIQAYNNALDGQEIRLKADIYPEDLVFNRPVGVVLSGGWNAEFGSNSGGEAILNGPVSISNGSVTIAGVIVIE